MGLRRVLAICIAVLSLSAAPEFATAQEADGHSVARQWNELLLDAIRNDFARPTVHARNLFHTSVAMWDAWAAYDDTAATYLHHERAGAVDVEEAREIAISYAAYRVLSSRFAGSPGADETIPALDAKMDDLGLDPSVVEVASATPAALGNRIAAAVLAFGGGDGANEANGYVNVFYRPVNDPLLPVFPGNPELDDFNRWQPLALEFFIDQSGNVLPQGTPDFLSPEWGAVTPFALLAEDRAVYTRGGSEYVVFHDPGAPLQHRGVGDEEYRAGFVQVVEWSSLLDPADGEMTDISPATRGNNTLGTNDGSGRATNPATGQPYAPQLVPAGDYYRVLAEFWADGPDSETPPGHWFTIANYVSDHPDVEHRIAGAGPEVNRLEWDVKLYLTMGGAMHDCAVAAWGVKGWYDYIRPVSAIRAMADLGQSSDPGQPGYHPAGIPLLADVIEVVTTASAAPGQRHEHLAGNENVGKIAVLAWRGPDFIGDPDATTAGVGWILAENWWPYQRPSFVTPPFAGYVSGHSTYSRAAAAVMTQFTGDEYFPGGLGEFFAPQNEFLVFEDGPSTDITLQWATYFDAADECSLSRIYGGIHPRADDIPGRLMGSEIGPDAVAQATAYFSPAPSIAIDRGRVRRRNSGKGVIRIKGTVTTGVNGPDDVLDVSGGLTLTIAHGATPLEVVRIGSDDCKVKKNGTIRGRLRRTVKTTFKPSKREPGVYEFKVRLRVPELAELVEAPLTLRAHSGRAVRAGTVATCTLNGKGTKLICE